MASLPGVWGQGAELVPLLPRKQEVMGVLSVFVWGSRHTLHASPTSVAFTLSPITNCKVTIYKALEKTQIKECLLLISSPSPNQQLLQFVYFPLRSKSQRGCAAAEPTAHQGQPGQTPDPGWGAGGSCLPGTCLPLCLAK